MPSPASESSSVPTVGSSSQESPYPPTDTPPSDVTINISYEESQCNVEKCPSPVEDRDRDSLVFDLPPSSESIPQVDAVVHPPVHPTSTPHGPSIPPLESEPTPVIIASYPESTTPMPAASTSSQDKAIHTPTLPDCSSSKPLTSSIGTTDTPSSSREFTPIENTASGDIRSQIEDVLPLIQPTCAPLESSPLDGSEFALASNATASTPGGAPPFPNLAHPETRTVHAPVHLEPLPSARLIQCIDNNLNPGSVAPTRIRTASPHGASLQVEVDPSPSAPPELPKPTSRVPTVNHAPPTSNTTVQSKTDPAYFLDQPISLTGSKATHTSGVPVLDGVPPLSERARSGAEIVRRPVTKPPPVPPREPTLPIVKRPALTGGTPVLHIIPTPSERPRPQVEATNTPIQNACAPPKPRIPSIATDSMSSFSRITPPGGHAKVETPPLPGRSVPVPPDPRTTLFGKQLPPLNSVPVRDMEVHSSSRSWIKSHPRKMMAPSGQRRSIALSTQMNPQSTVQPSGLPSVPPVERSTARPAPSYSNPSRYHTSSIEPSNVGAIPESRGGHRGHARGPAVHPSAQVSVAVCFRFHTVE